jgi:hypothetical protein
MEGSERSGTSRSCGESEVEDTAHVSEGTVQGLVDIEDPQ